jgi:hypothetical protein
MSTKKLTGMDAIVDPLFLFPLIGRNTLISAEGSAIMRPSRSIYASLLGCGLSINSYEGVYPKLII